MRAKKFLLFLALSPVLWPIAFIIALLIEAWRRGMFDVLLRGGL